MHMKLHKKCASGIQLLIEIGIIFRSAETSATKQECNFGQSSHAGLASLIPRKNEPSMASTTLGWRVGLASLLFKKAD